MKKFLQITLASTLCLSPMAMLAQAIDFTQYGSTQVINSDFEDWNGPEYKNVPVGWHSFESVGGEDELIVNLANSDKHTSKETQGLHEGTIGKSCLKLVPRRIIFAMANGTISTGQMIAGAYVADDPKNHAQMDISVTETSNGTPFYAKLTKRPVALSVWVKFTQGTVQKEHPYATVSAAITNGKYYQEPTADKDSSVVIGYAQNNKIASNGGKWQHLYVPFRYDSPNFNKTDSPKAIMVTFSTNADPGQGSVGDVLLIDDFELIYEQTVTIPERGYAMFTNIAMDNHKAVIPKGLTAYTLENNGSGLPIVKDTYVAGQVLPYNGAVLLKGKPGVYEFKTTLYEKEENVVAEGDICIVKAAELNDPKSDYKYYYLTGENNTLGFYEASYGLKIQENEALLRVKASMAAANYPYVLVQPKMKGDINEDGNLSVADVMSIVNRLLGKIEKGNLMLVDADVNDDNDTTIADAMSLVSKILQ